LYIDSKYFGVAVARPLDVLPASEGGVAYPLKHTSSSLVIVPNVVALAQTVSTYVVIPKNLGGLG